MKIYCVEGYMAYRSHDRWTVDYYSNKESAQEAASILDAQARAEEQEAEGRGEFFDAPCYSVKEVTVHD